MFRQRLLCLILALVTLLAYLPVAKHDFIVYDDPDYVTDNHIVQAGLAPATVQWAFTTFHASNWHPLTWLSHALDCQLFDLNPGAHHLINVLWHCANAVLLFLLLLRLTSAIWPAAFIAALFAWHPLHVESVAWVAERKDVLSTFLGLLALLYYVEYAQSKLAKGRNYYLALLFFALSLMAKPMLVTLPFLFLLLDYWPLDRLSNFRCVFEKWPFFILTTASCILTYLAQRSEAVVSFERLPFSPRAANALVSCGRYLEKIFWPTDLAVLYPLPSQVSGINIAIACSLLLIISAFAWHLRREKPYLLVGWLWFLGTLVPVIGLVQVGGQSMADRYTYLPAIGIFIIVACGAKDIASRMRLPTPVVSTISGLVLAASLGLTVHQLGYWQDSETLFTHAIVVTQKNDVARINLGVALEKKGRPKEALPLYLEALEINPRRVEVQVNVANLLSAEGRRDEALTHYQEALRLKPRSPLAHLNFGAFLMEAGQPAEAVQHDAEAARLDPTDPRPHIQMGKASLHLDQTPEAITHFRDALQRDPNNIQTLNVLARILASDTHAELRDGAQAVVLAEKANMLTAGEQPLILDTLAMAYAEAGRFEDARQTVQRAVQIVTPTGPSDLLSTLQQHLQLYQSHQPCREPLTHTAH